MSLSSPGLFQTWPDGKFSCLPLQVGPLERETEARVELPLKPGLAVLVVVQLSQVYFWTATSVTRVTQPVPALMALKSAGPPGAGRSPLAQVFHASSGRLRAK